MTIKAIETQYKGYRFRSRLEARWAVFFDALGVAWEYEREGYDLGEAGWYLPDFWMPDFFCWIEVKGEFQGDCTAIDNPAFKAASLERETGNPVVFFGPIPCDTDERFWHTHHSNLCFSRSFPLTIDGTLSGEDGGAWGLHLYCPVCRFEYVHFQKPIYQASDDYEAWGGRGSACRIPMYCEMGHSWTLRFGFHKGYTYMDFENVTVEVDHPGLIFADNDKTKLKKAIKAARSARFEHGEKP